MAGLWRGCGGAVAGLWRGCGGAVAGLWRGCGGAVHLLFDENFAQESRDTWGDSFPLSTSKPCKRSRAIFLLQWLQEKVKNEKRLVKVKSLVEHILVSSNSISCLNTITSCHQLCPWCFDSQVIISRSCPSHCRSCD